MQFVFLPTDVLLYLLVVSIVAFIIWSRHYEHLRRPWQTVLKNKVGMVSLMVLLSYICIGLLDSIHFTKLNYHGEVKSFLDVLVSPLGEQNEQTYSSPFSSHLFMKSVVQMPDGTVKQEYPALSYGGVINNTTDIALRVGIASLLGLFVGSGFSLAFLFYLARRRKMPFLDYWRSLKQGETSAAWREMLITLIILIILIANCIALASKYHILGTGKIGQDIFYESIKSIRTGLVIGTLTTLITLPFAVILGMIAGYYGGWLDDFIQYTYTTLSSIPGVLLITAAILSLQIFIENHPQLFTTLAMRADIRLLALCVILGIASWTSLCRLLRAETLKLREMDFVAAAVTLGTKRYKILLQHIFPNLMYIILITVILDFSGLVLAEAVLSYVGVGVDPSTISWGNMINSARLELAREPVVWWPLFAAFLFMFIFVLSANLFADVVRDAFDPRLKGVEQE